MATYSNIMSIFYTFFNVIQILFNESLGNFYETQIWLSSILRGTLLPWKFANAVTMATYSNNMPNFCVQLSLKNYPMNLYEIFRVTGTTLYYTKKYIVTMDINWCGIHGNILAIFCQIISPILM